jgi:phage tail-like protein
MALGRDGRLYVLDASRGGPAGGPRIWRADRDGGASALVALDGLPAAVVPAALAVDARGRILIGDGREAAGEEERVIHRFDATGTAGSPLVGYRGPAYHMAWGRGDRLFIVGARGIAIIPLAPEPQFRAAGSFVLPVVDSTSPETAWHRIVMDAECPPGTRVEIRYRVANHPDTADALRLLPAEQWSAPLINLPEAWIDGVGRYLAIRGDLFTNDTSKTPAVRRLVADFPRRSLARDLPAVFQEDPASREFLDRFLALFESLIDRVETRIDGLPALIDPAAAPAEALPWLAGWMALVLEDGLTEAQRRRFVAEAMSLYRQRGTPEGIRRAVEMAFGEAPPRFDPGLLDRIEDPALKAEYRRALDAPACWLVEPVVWGPTLAALADAGLRAEIEGLVGTGASRFLLLVDRPSPDAAALDLIRRVVQDQTPAHVMACVTDLRPWLHLGRHTLLGVNTFLASPALRLEDSVLAGGEVGLTDPERAGQSDRRGRTEIDTALA